MNDYTFLEDVGRKAKECGSDIIKNGLNRDMKRTKSNPTNGRRFKGRPMPERETKRDILRARLEQLGIDVDLLPLGMERRSHNQSVLDSK